ncbi:GD24276 [Drosophila simulans]|uniref:GD24276 n=1 Tax=Drosophila simulans TaxID=7240 RepID=B4Q3G7_DROSI|nr:GD24276 [Drosophila simulans]
MSDELWRRLTEALHSQAADQQMIMRMLLTWLVVLVVLLTAGGGGGGALMTSSWQWLHPPTDSTFFLWHATDGTSTTPRDPWTLHSTGREGKKRNLEGDYWSWQMELLRVNRCAVCGDGLHLRGGVGCRYDYEEWPKEATINNGYPDSCRGDNSQRTTDRE